MLSPPSLTEPDSPRSPIETIAAAKRDLVLPYVPALQFLSGFDSTKTRTLPLTTSRAFGAEDIDMELDGGNASSMESMSKTIGVENTHSHIMVGAGVGVGCPLLGASVSVQFSDDITTTDNTLQYSLHKRCTSGMLTFRKPPRLSQTALDVLRGDDGVAEFQKLFGDYFVAGFLIGEEMGLRFSKEVKTEEDIKTVSFTLELHVLFWSISKTFSTTTVNEMASTTCSLTTFSSLDSDYTPRTVLHPNNSETSEQSDNKAAVAIMCMRANTFAQQASTVDQRLRERISTLEVAAARRDGWAMEDIEDIARSGWVVGLWLVRYETLAEWQEAAWSKLSAQSAD